MRKSDASVVSISVIIQKGKMFIIQELDDVLIGQPASVGVSHLTIKRATNIRLGVLDCLFSRLTEP